MNKPFKPHGYNSVSPYFIVRDSSRWIALMEQVFSARVTRRYDNEDGTLMHAEMQIDDSIIMLSEATGKYPANQLLIHVYVPDAMEVYRKAIAAGCEGMEEPVHKDNDPDLRGQFRDYVGNVWAIGTQQQS